jgi:Transglutaminase-like superfamily/Coenzyme PQQ synthesis protein D (PqqD)
VLLDLSGNAYHVLDEVAARMWLAASNQARAPDDAVAELIRGFDCEPTTIARDYAEFVSRAIDDGLLVTALAPIEPPPMPRNERRPHWPTLDAWNCLARTVRSLRVRGLRPTYDDARALGIAPAPQGGADLGRALVSFTRAENFMMLRSAPRDCLPRSLALFRFLRRMGIAARHVIGVELDPFAAHSWVEVEGKVVHDADWRWSYAVIASIDP